MHPSCKKWLFPVLLVVITAVFYIPGINDHFLSDDYDHIMFAQSVDDFNSFVKLLQIPGGTYRPVMNASMTIDYLIWGARPIGFHLTNIVFFLGTVLLIFAIVKMITRHELMAFFAALFFLLWPSHHESVTWIAGRTDVLATFFYVLALYLFIRFVQSRNYWWMAAVFVTSVFCFFSKEIGVTLPFVLVAVFIMYLRQYSSLSIKKTVAIIWLPYIVLLAAYLVIRRGIVGSWVGGYTMFGQVSMSAFVSAGAKFILTPYYLVKYLVNYDWLAQFHRIFTNTTFINVVSVVMVVVGMVVMWWLNRHYAKSKLFVVTVIGLVIAVYFVAIPGASIIPSLKTNLMNTRVLYLSTLPMSVLVAYLLLRHPEERRKTKIGISVGLACFLAILFVINYMPWREASRTATAMLADITVKHPEFSDISYKTYDREILFTGIPDNVYGAFLFRNGFGESLQIAFQNKNLFTSPGRKVVWVIQDKKNPITTTCNFNGKNKQTTGIMVLYWDGVLKQFVEQPQYAEQYQRRSELQTQYASQVAVLNSETWTGMEYQGTTPGGTGLTSPEVVMPPLSLKSLSFTLGSQVDTVADFSWWVDTDTSFVSSHTILMPVKAGTHEYIIHLDQCPAWFLHDTVRQLRLIPSEKSQSITISDISVQ